MNKYREGIFGNDNQPGVGLPSRIADERKLRLDFLPFFERSVLRYGVQIDHINYYSDILKKYINSTEYLQNKARTKRKFIFRRDPRDISVIYFWDPELKDYFDIPYANGNHPPISLWDYNYALKNLKKSDATIIDEAAIFTSHNKLQSLVNESIKKTSKAKKNFLNSLNRKTIKGELPVKARTESILPPASINFKSIKPYED
jgi:putative transposase